MRCRTPMDQTYLRRKNYWKKTGYRFEEDRCTNPATFALRVAHDLVYYLCDDCVRKVHLIRLQTSGENKICHVPIKSRNEER